MRPSLFKKFRAGDHLQEEEGEGGNAQNTKGINSSNAEIIIVIYNIRYAFICISVGAISAMCSSHICEL